jgi:pimeloyl-ACP methyl ester carboxylesterase
MVARITRILLLVQLAAGIGIALVLQRFAGLDNIWLAAMLGVGAVGLVRLLINANNFFLAWLYRSETPLAYRLDWRQACRMYLEEFKASMLSSSWYMPFHAFSKRDAPYSTSLPVLLVHGYGCNSGYWHKMSRRLSQANISHHAINLEPVFGDIDDFVPAIHQAVELLCRESGHEKIIIVAHSMGGLAVRAYLCVHGSQRTAKVITLGTPHHGTGLAHFGAGKNSKQMRWLGSAVKGQPNDWLCRLAAKEDRANDALFVSIYSHHDNIVAPQESCCLPRARNLAFHGIGHVALAMNAKVQDKVMEEISVLC